LNRCKKPSDWKSKSTRGKICDVVTCAKHGQEIFRTFLASPNRAKVVETMRFMLLKSKKEKECWKAVNVYRNVVGLPTCHKRSERANTMLKVFESCCHFGYAAFMTCFSLLTDLQRQTVRNLVFRANVFGPFHVYDYQKGFDKFLGLCEDDRRDMTRRMWRRLGTEVIKKIGKLSKLVAYDGKDWETLYNIFINHSYFVSNAVFVEVCRNTHFWTEEIDRLSEEDISYSCSPPSYKEASVKKARIF
jgi:hypothetical protein